MSVIRYKSKLFNGTESQAYIYFDYDDNVILHVNEKMTEKEYIGFVQRLANDAIRRKLLTVEEISE